MVSLNISHSFEEEFLSSNAIESVLNFVAPIRFFFYLVHPSELYVEEYDKVPKYLSIAIPYFFLLVSFEFFLAIYRGKYQYSFEDTGVLQQMLTLFVKSLSYAPYIYCYEHFRILNLPVNSLYNFLAAMMGVDMCYYWFHRFCHEYHFMWATHSVHHSGEFYNVATALRQGAYQSVLSWLFYIPLSIIGFHPAVFMSHSGLNLIYQFWIHTEHIHSLGPLELVMNTPAHHRMHHRPPGNCNYAGVFIIWDRIFGTFREETERKDFYGLASSIQSLNPLYYNIQHFFRVRNIHNNKKSDVDCLDSVSTSAATPAQDMAGVRAGGGSASGSLASVLVYLQQCFKKRVHHPLAVTLSPKVFASYIPLQAGDSGPINVVREKYTGRNTSIFVKLHIATQMIIFVALTAVFLEMADKLPLSPKIFTICVAVHTMVNFGLLGDARPNARASETIRILIVCCFLICLGTVDQAPDVTGISLWADENNCKNWVYASFVMSLTWMGVYLSH